MAYLLLVWYHYRMYTVWGLWWHDWWSASIDMWLCRFVSTKCRTYNLLVVDIQMNNGGLKRTLGYQWWPLQHQPTYPVATCPSWNIYFCLNGCSSRVQGRTSCRKISWIIGAARGGFSLFQSLWNLTGTSEAALRTCLSNFRGIRSL